MIYGYTRVSTALQRRDGNSLEEQTASLEKYGCPYSVAIVDFKGLYCKNHQISTSHCLISISCFSLVRLTKYSFHPHTRT